MCFNIGNARCYRRQFGHSQSLGVIIGPILGGLLANPVESYPRLFGDNSILGGKHGIWWMKHWPYALPNLLSAVFLFSGATAIFFGLEEVRLSSIALIPGD